jgi:hypothetical protein
MKTRAILFLAVLFICFSNVKADTWKTIDFPGSTKTDVRGISDNNIVGNYNDDLGRHGFLYNGTTWTTLNNPVSVNGTSIYGIDGNNIVGCYYDYSGTTHGFLYNGTTWTTLNNPGATYTEAYGIDGNNIVGWTEYSGVRHGFLYNGEEISDPNNWALLDMPGAIRTEIHGIDGDNLVGCYVDTNGNIHGFIYGPDVVPEPATIVLLITGLIAGGFFLRRKK